MNILIVTQYFWPEDFRINNLARKLIDSGHKITVLTGIPNYPEGSFYKGYGFISNRKQNHEGVDIIRVPIIPRGKGKKIQLVLNYLSYVLSASILGPFLCPAKCDVIFVFEPSPITVGLPAVLLRTLKKAPIMFWVQDLWPETLTAVNATKSKIILMAVNSIVSFIYKRCDRILIQSEAFKSSIKKIGINENRILYFPNSAEEFYEPITLNLNDHEATMMPVGFRIVFAGNIGVAQDFGTILQAAYKLKKNDDIKWVIIGDGRMRAWLETEIQRLELNNTIFLIGRYPVESMPRYFSCADALLVTLKKDPIFALTIPAKIQSYLACGKPIIAGLDGEGARIINEAKAGVACKSENPDELAEAVLAIYRMSQVQRQRMGKSGRKYFEKHFESKMLVNRLESYIQDLVH